MEIIPHLFCVFIFLIYFLANPQSDICLVVFYSPFIFTEKSKSISSQDAKRQKSLESKTEISNSGSEHIAAQTFTFRELAAATRNFRADCLLGEGGFGRVYKGRLEGTNQVGFDILGILVFLNRILNIIIIFVNLQQ